MVLRGCDAGWMPRATWSGAISFGMVNIPVKLYTATGRHTVRFNQIDTRTGSRIRQRRVSEADGSEVPAEAIAKGYELASGQYVIVSEDELAALDPEASRTIDLIEFVDQESIDPIYYDRPYYVVPEGELAEDAFRVVRDALRRTGKVGLGQIVMRGREYIGALAPCGKGMMLETLRFDEELRQSETYFDGISDAKSDKGLVELAEELIQRQAGPFSPEAFSDSYTNALEELVKAKLKGRKAISLEEDKPEERDGEVVDLMEALKKSLGAKGGGKAKSTGSSKASKTSFSRLKTST